MATVQEIVALAAGNLGREDLQAAIAEGSDETGEVASLVRCYNLVENEVALDYFPLKTNETVSVGNGKIYYSQLSHAPVNVHKVLRPDGTETSFQLFPSYISLLSGESRVEIEYSYVPETKTIAAVSAFSGKISPRLLSYGVAAQFCLTAARFQEATMWEERYRGALGAAGILRRKLCVDSRRWV